MLLCKVIAPIPFIGFGSVSIARVTLPPEEGTASLQRITNGFSRPAKEYAGVVISIAGESRTGVARVLFAVTRSSWPPLAWATVST